MSAYQFEEEAEDLWPAALWILGPVALAIGGAIWFALKYAPV